MMKSRILITGANGQIGSELVDALRERHGVDAVVASDVQEPTAGRGGDDGPFEIVDVTDADALRAAVEGSAVDTIYHLATLLSAVGEERPDRAWTVNVDGLKHVLDLARERDLRVFWPSSIAVFGAATPPDETPQTTVLDPSTMYGVSKVSGEFMCRYYHDRFGVDVRSVRYPGIVSYKTAPGGGTTDYAVEAFYAAVRRKPYTCFLRPETRLPMMYMPDAIRAALDVMDAPDRAVRARTSYNVGAMSFSAMELVRAIRRHRPEFVVHYRPDHRQRIADTWPHSLDDRDARKDWGWQPQHDLPAMVKDMLEQLEARRPLEATSS